jgi:hypothetical protein
MAVNPNIALSVRGLELPDPLAQYGKVQAIQQAQQQNALARMQMQQAEREVQQRNALNRAYSEAYSPEGSLDYNKLMSSLATGGFGSQIPAIQEQRLKTQKARTEQEKAQAELLTSKLQQSRSFLDTLDPTLPDAAQRYLSWHEANHADPVIGPALAARGVTVDTARAEIDQALQTPNGLQNLINRSAMGIEKFMQFVKPSTIQVDRGGEKLLVETAPGQAPRTVGRYGDVPLPPDVLAQRKEVAQAGVQPVQRTYDTTIMKSAADRDMALVTNAEALPAQISKLDQSLAVLESGQPFTGALSELELGIARLKSKYTKDKDAGVRVTDTEYLNSLLGSDVFQQIGILGIGARGLDTPAEREFLKEVISGTTALSRDTLIKMLENRRNAFADMAEKYNNRLKEGRLDAYLAVDPGATGQPLQIPKRTTRGQPGPISTPPSEAIDILRANDTDLYRQQFDEVFGKGAAERVLSGGR